MKEIVIVLFLLVPGNKIEQKYITIYESCYTWFKKNVAVSERKKKLFSNLYYHSYKKQKVVGYHCHD